MALNYFQFPVFSLQKLCTTAVLLIIILPALSFGDDDRLHPVIDLATTKIEIEKNFTGIDLKELKSKKKFYLNTLLSFDKKYTNLDAAQASLLNALLRYDDQRAKILIDNLFVNIIFFDVSKTYNPFLNSTFQQFGIYANFGLIYTLGYPLQTLFLFILIFFLKKIIDLFSNYDDFFLIVYCFSIFKILRGSSIYGLSFILKFEILLLMIIFLSIILKKLNLFKSSS